MTNENKAPNLIDKDKVLEWLNSQVEINMRAIVLTPSEAAYVRAAYNTAIKYISSLPLEQVEQGAAMTEEQIEDEANVIYEQFVGKNPSRRAEEEFEAIVQAIKFGMQLTLEAKDGWISVKDGLPEDESEPVLVCSNFNGSLDYTLACCKKDRHSDFYDYQQGHALQNIIFWKSISPPLSTKTPTPNNQKP